MKSFCVICGDPLELGAGLCCSADCQRSFDNRALRSERISAPDLSAGGRHRRAMRASSELTIVREPLVYVVPSTWIHASDSWKICALGPKDWKSSDSEAASVAHRRAIRHRKVIFGYGLPTAHLWAALESNRPLELADGLEIAVSAGPEMIRWGEQLWLGSDPYFDQRFPSAVYAIIQTAITRWSGFEKGVRRARAVAICAAAKSASNLLSWERWMSLALENPDVSMYELLHYPKLHRHEVDWLERFPAWWRSLPRTQRDLVRRRVKSELAVVRTLCDYSVSQSFIDAIYDASFKAHSMRILVKMYANTLRGHVE